MSRAALPTRRPSEVRRVSFRGREFTVCAGFYPDGRIGEVFVNGEREGSEMEAILSDAAVIASIALQNGASPADLTRSLGRVPEPWRGENVCGPASPIGAVIAALVEIAEGPA